MARKKIQIKGKELEDAEVSHISLVSRPANRLPFRITKADPEPSSEEKSMFTLDIFKSRKADEEPTVAAVIVNATYADAMAQKLETDGFAVDQREDHDGVVVFKQADYTDEEVKGFQLSEHVGVLVKTQKAFDSFPDSMSFDENIQQAGFLPGVAHATMALEDTVRAILFKSEDKDEAVSQLETSLGEFRDWVLNLAGQLPERAFKVEKAAKSLTEEDAVETPTAEPEKTDEPAAKADEETGDEEVTKEEGAEEIAEAVPGDLDEGVKKGGDPDPEADDADDPDKVEKAGDEKLDQVLQAVKGLNEKVDGVAEAQKALDERVQATEAGIKKAEKALSGTAVMEPGGDTVAEEEDPDGGEPARKSDDPWAGTALDRVASMA